MGLLWANLLFYILHLSHLNDRTGEQEAIAWLSLVGPLLSRLVRLVTLVTIIWLVRLTSVEGWVGLLCWFSKYETWAEFSTLEVSVCMLCAYVSSEQNGLTLKLGPYNF